MKKLIWVMMIFCSSNVALADIYPDWYDEKLGYDEVGEIVHISSSEIHFDDLFFKLSPTVKVSTLEKRRELLLNLKAGDTVGIRMTTINGKPYVSHIYEKIYQ